MKKKVKLTRHQIKALIDAQHSNPIHCEHIALRNAQKLDGSNAHALHTCQALLGYGYLTLNGAGGYVLTEAGLRALIDATGTSFK